MLKRIRIINLHTTKNTPPVIINAAKLTDYVGCADSPPFPTMAAHKEWNDCWRQVQDINLQGGKIGEKQVDKEELLL